MYNMMLKRQQRLQITACSGVDDRSIKRVYTGERVWALTRRRVEEAARALKLPLPGKDIATQSAENTVFAARVREEAARLGPLVPEIDPHDLLLILGRRLRPWGSGQKFFIRRSPEGHYVF